MNFNPRSPDGERRQARAPQRNQIYFNPRSPDGERPELENSWLHMSRISIHAPRMGSDRRGSGSPSASVRFQSTLPGWGATQQDVGAPQFGDISIHAPRMGSDRLREPHSQRRRCISIHAPRMGSDRLPQYWHGSVVIFQSTLPGWGATWFLIASKWQSLFQSTLPGWGATGR